jgi:UDP-N-acetylmuramoyl-tripeptide--D-alanyl-D-alanine ligase
VRAASPAAGGASHPSGPAEGPGPGEGPDDVHIVGISTDSRALVPGSAFVALRGVRFDGHDHVAAAVNQGARLVIVEREVDVPPEVGVLRVEDSTRALGALGRAHRRRWAGAGERRALVAITGSAGKTTTKRAVAALLEGLGERVHASAGNLNNAIGVPMVLLGLEPEHTVAVVEIGTNSRGEIAYGAGLAEPDVGVLTLVADAHGEGIGTVDDVAHEKGALLAALSPGGVAIVNGDDPRVVAQLARCRAERKLTVGTVEGTDVRLTTAQLLGTEGVRHEAELGTRSPPEVLAFTTPLLGTAGRFASGFALAVAEALLPGRADGASLSAAFATLAGGQAGRLAPLELEDGTIVLDDAYNANGASMLASIGDAAALAAALGRRLVLVLGDMYELGAASERVHGEVAARAVAARPAALIAVGEAARQYHLVAKSGSVDSVAVPDAQRALEALTSTMRPRDVVLVKGSHGVGLSRVVEGITRRAARAGSPTEAS